MSFKKDVNIVTSAMTELAIVEEYQGDYGKYEWLYKCHYCDSSDPEPDKVKHTLDCPVLVAQDLLTRNI